LCFSAPEAARAWDESTGDERKKIHRLIEKNQQKSTACQDLRSPGKRKATRNQRARSGKITKKPEESGSYQSGKQTGPVNERKTPQARKVQFFFERPILGGLVREGEY